MLAKPKPALSVIGSFVIRNWRRRRRNFQLICFLECLLLICFAFFISRFNTKLLLDNLHFNFKSVEFLFGLSLRVFSWKETVLIRFSIILSCYKCLAHLNIFLSPNYQNPISWLWTVAVRPKPPANHEKTSMVSPTGDRHRRSVQSLGILWSTYSPISYFLPWSKLHACIKVRWGS